MSNGTLNDQVYQKIKNDIMYLVLEPGVAVSVQKLADAYGSSRTPVREAVVRLQQEGLVIIYPQARTIVSPINLTRIREERFIRNSLELAMVDSFIKNCSTLVTDTLENVIGIQCRAIRRNNIREFYEMDKRFHRILFETAEQYLAYDFIESSNTHYNRMCFLSIKHSGFNLEVIPEHDAIVNAAKQRDGEHMRELLAEHLGKMQAKMLELSKLYPNYFTE